MGNMLRYYINVIESVRILWIKPADLGQLGEITEKNNKDDNL